MAHSKECLRDSIHPRDMGEDEKSAKDRKIKGRLFGLDVFPDAQNFFVYISTEKEVSTHSIITELLERGKNVFAPHIEKESREMTPVQIRDYPEELVEGPFGIMQPKKDGSNCVHQDKIDMSIVPGVAFDESGNRVGHGFGYYDRFLRDLNSTVIALAYEFQVVENMDRDPWDVPVDLIITERRKINC